MKQKPSNPSAYPVHGQQMLANGQWDQQWEPGMTLRDYFAGQALAGIMACRECSGELNVAHYSYAIADAMLAEREREVAP